MCIVTYVGTNFKYLRMRESDLLLADTMDEIHPIVRQLLSIGKHYAPSSITRKCAKSGRRTGASARAMDFMSRTLDYSEWSTSDTIKVTDAINVARTVMQCTSLARNISRSNSTLFLVRQDRRKNAPVLWHQPSGYDFLLSTIDKKTARLGKHLPYCAFNPYVELFLKVRAEFLQKTSSLPVEIDNTYKLVSELNRAIESLRNEARSENFRKGLDRFQRNIRKNYGGVKDYLKSICEKQKDYEIYDIKLFFPHAEEESPNHTLRSEKNPLHRYRLEWLKKILKTIPKDSLIGHVWSIQYGFTYAWHYRVIAVLKSTSDNSPRSWFPGVVQETWADTVKGHTYCIPALIGPRRTNNPVNRYKSHMAEPNRTLTDIASALTKPDYFAKATLSHGTRALGRGVLHSKKTRHQN